MAARLATRAVLGALLIVTVATSAATPVRAEDDGGVGSPLDFGTGSRALALGRTGVGFASGPDAVFWNAGRLAVVEHVGLSLFHTDLFVDGASYNAGFVAYPTLDAGVFALGFQRIGVSDLERRDERNQLLGTFENAESALSIGYGRRFGRELSLGAALRVVQQSVDAASDATLGLDLGLAYERIVGRSGVHRVGLGLNLQNVVTPRFRLADVEVPDPRTVKLGAAWTLAPGRGQLVWMLAADLDLPNRADPRAGAGVEMTFRNLLALRAGVDGSAPTFGAGVAWRNVRFDYALVQHEALDRGDRFSLELRFGRSAHERRMARQKAREREVTATLERQLAERETQERARARTEAAAAFEAQRFDEALRLYRRVLLLDPQDQEATASADAAELELALAAAADRLKRGEVGEAAGAYQAITERWPQDPRAAKELAAARATLAQTADRDRQLNALLKQALAAFSQSDLVSADAALRELLVLDPEHEVGKDLAARIATDRKTAGEQALTRARAAAAKRDWETAQARLAEARRLLGGRKELSALAAEWARAGAATEKNEDTASRPPSVPATVGAGAIAPERRSSPDAAQRGALDARYRDGLAAFEKGDFQQAIRDWRTVWLEWPEYPSVADHLIKAYLCEGVALYSSGKYEVAIEHCRRVLEIDPSNAKARRYLQRMLEEQSELQEIGGPHGRD